jgi:hypothetical protein
LALLAGCAQFKAPFGENIQKLDLTSRKLEATVQLSSPQLFKREDLINERRDELKYLRGQLAESEKIAFAPELLRDIETVSTLSAQLGLSFDAGIRKQASQAAEVNDLVQEISVLRLRAQLDQLNRDVELLRAGLASQTAVSSPIGTSATPVTAPTLPVPALPALDGISKAIADLAARLDKASVAPRAAAATISPIDVFKDRQAYRRVLQSAINAASLDDLQDFDGSSLFRLQFRATLLPPDASANESLGVLRMRVRAPAIKADVSGEYRFVRDLYAEWLDHVTRRLNEAFRDGAFTGDPGLLVLGSTDQAFSLVTITIPKKTGAKKCPQVDIATGLESQPADADCRYVHLAIPRLQETSAEGRQSRSLAGLKGRLDVLLGNATAMRTRAASGAPNAESVEDAKAFSRSLCDALATSVRQMKLLSASLVAPNSDLTLTDLIAVYARLDQLSQAASCDDTPNRLPPEFIDALFSKESKGVVLHALGNASTYAVTPTELAQQVSTAARAANALQIAASLSAVLPTSGWGGNASAAYGRAAEGRADALSRLPLVVGYSEPGAATGKDNALDPGFGWILGPRLVVDAKKNVMALEHHLAPYDLTADIVMPGWWPYFELDYEGEWGPDLKDPGRFSSFVPGANVATRGRGTLRVPRRHNRSDLDGVTSLVLNSRLGRRVEVPSIAHVEPSTLSACAGKVTILVQGTNIWRSEAAYLGGLAASDVTVLPDMAGVAATFDMTQVPQRPSHFAPSRLTLTTPTGTASVDVTLDGSRLGAKGCGDEATAPPSGDDGAPSISSVVPAAVYACDAPLHIVLKGKNLAKVTSVHLGNQEVPDKKLKRLPGGELEFTVEQALGDAFGSAASVPVIVTNDKGTTSANLAVERDECKGKGVSSTRKTAAVSLLATPAGRIDVCARQATLLLVGKNNNRFDGATLSVTKPKAAVISAQTFKLLQRQGVAEITFVGLPTQGIPDASGVDATVQVQLYKGADKVGDPIAVDATCSGTSEGK